MRQCQQQQPNSLPPFDRDVIQAANLQSLAARKWRRMQHRRSAAVLSGRTTAVEGAIVPFRQCQQLKDVMMSAITV